MSFVEMGHELAIAVIEQGRHLPAGAELALGRLAPARVVDFRVDVGPEAVLAVADLLPEADRALVGEGEAGDRLDRLEAVFPRHREAERRAVLLRHRLAVGAGRDEGELVGRLLDRQRLQIGPRIPGLALRRGDGGVVEAVHRHVFRADRRSRHCDQRGQRKTAPRHRDRPGLDAAVAVEPLFERHLADQRIGVDGERFLDHAVDGHRPGAGL